MDSKTDNTITVNTTMANTMKHETKCTSGPGREASRSSVTLSRSPSSTKSRRSSSPKTKKRQSSWRENGWIPYTCGPKGTHYGRRVSPVKDLVFCIKKPNGKLGRPAVIVSRAAFDHVLSAEWPGPFRSEKAKEEKPMTEKQKRVHEELRKMMEED